MNADGRCDETRELLPEIALGIADGADRAQVLEHVADCAECRLELDRQSTIADELLALAPEEEPRPGFELGVLRAIEPPPAKRRSILRPWPALAAAAAAALITAGAMVFAFRDDRRLADQYRATLARAHGTYFGSIRLSDAAGRPGGVLYRYQGSPSWLLVTVAPPHRASIERAELVLRSGRRIPLASFRLVDGTWGGSLRVDLREVAAIHLVGRDGRSVLVAQF
jgi:hypothetical protein